MTCRQCLCVLYFLQNSVFSTTEWGMEWQCQSTKLDFCSLEGMCNYPESCPLSPSGEFGGMSLNPHPPKTLEDLVTGDRADVQWDYQ